LRDVEIGGTIGFYLDMLLLSGDDNIVSVPANINDVVEIGHREVVEVAGLVLLSLRCAFPALGAFGVSEPASLFLNIVFIFHLHNILGVVNMIR
jgi:hypothetical protein